MSIRGDNIEELRLPWNPREGILYGCIIASLSSFLIGGYNVYDSLGYDLEHLYDFITDFIVVWPVVFVVAFLLAGTVVQKISRWILSKFLSPGHGINAYLFCNITVSVLLMSAIMSFMGGLVGHCIGALMGNGDLDIMGLVEIWPSIWPRNFCIAFFLEMLFVQPLARNVMVRIHRRKLNSAVADGAEAIQ